MTMLGKAGFNAQTHTELILYITPGEGYNVDVKVAVEDYRAAHNYS